MSSNTVVNQGEQGALCGPVNPGTDSETEVRMENRRRSSAPPATQSWAWARDRDRYDWMDWHSFSDYQG
jgi:hypothetical protein